MKKNIFTICILFMFLFYQIVTIVFGAPIIISNEKEIQSVPSFSNSLSDNIWPMFQHNARHTGRSPFGAFGEWRILKWKFMMDGSVVSNPTIAKDGTIYIGGWWYFYAINPDGSLKWTYEFKYGNVESSATIDENGNIYFGTTSSSLEDYFYALYPNGTLKWRYLVDNVFTSPIICDDGTIIFGDCDNYIKALYPNGTLRWQYETGASVRSSPAIGDDGTIFCGSHDGYLYALYPNNGTLKWRYSVGCWIGGDPTVADDGTILFGAVQKGALYALYPNGTYKWHLTLGSNVVSSPAIVEDGTIYVAAYKAGATGAYIYSIDPNEPSINWRYEVEDEAMSASPVIDKYGIVYIGGWGGYEWGKLYAFNPDGTLRWEFPTGDAIYRSAAIGEDGTLYVGSWDDHLYAVKPIDDEPPGKPSIFGPNKGGINIEYTYNSETTDPDGDNVSYFFDWGDGSNSGWTEFVPSGTPVSRDHSWKFGGNFKVKVKAKDEYDRESEWEILMVTMPKSKAILLNTFLKNLLRQFPLLERILYFVK